MANTDLMRMICALLDDLRPRADGRTCHKLISFVADQPGHDRRYPNDASKIERELGWRPTESFETRIFKTIASYVDQPNWTADVQSGACRNWIDRNYLARPSHA